MKVPWGDRKNGENGEWGRVLVYGLGISGLAAARFLLARGVEIVAVDGKRREDLELGELAGDARLTILDESAALPAVDGVVVSPGVPLDRPLLAEAQRRGIPVIAEVELAFPFLDGPVVAITGSNGKSTTTALAGAMLRASGLAAEVCGNIGEPLVGKVDGPAGRIFVVELSSFQIEGLVTFKPTAAALLNIAEDHLDRYGSLAVYAAAKKALFRGMDATGIAVLNADDPATLDLATAARRRLFSRRGAVADGCWADGDRVLEVEAGVASSSSGAELFAVADLPLAGVQNLENAMAAALLARAVGAPAAGIRAGLADFHGLPHRLERVAEVAGIGWYDDSKGTNPAATAKSLEGFADSSVHLILGGRNKGADLAVLAPLVRAKARQVYLIGEAAPELAAALGDAAPVERSGTLAAAVAAAASRARAGESVVLSPACASFDQFRNFSHRGEVFQSLVQALARGGA